MHDSEPSNLSSHYSFRYNGKALRIYRGDIMEQVVFGIGGEFGWSDEGKGYAIILKEVRTGEPLDMNADGTPGPLDMWGIFDLSVYDPVTGKDNHSDIEIKR